MKQNKQHFVILGNGSPREIIPQYFVKVSYESVKNRVIKKYPKSIVQCTYVKLNPREKNKMREE